MITHPAPSRHSRPGTVQVGIFPPLGQSPPAARNGAVLTRVADAGVDHVCVGDHVSFFVGGRLTLGVGIGGEDRHEIEICGVDPRTRGRRMDECLQILRALSGGEPVTFEGEFFSLQDALILPAPAGGQL